MNESIDITPELHSRSSHQSSLATILPHLPLLSSVQSGWQEMTLEHFRYPAFETPEYAHGNHKIAIHTHLPSNLWVKRRLDGKVQYEQVLTEQVIVVPAHVTHQVQWNQTSEFLVLTLKPEVLKQFAYDQIAPDRVELVPCLPRPDPLIQQLGLTLKSELMMNGGQDSLYVESLVNCLALHLLKNYTASPPTLTAPPSRQLARSDLQQAITYIQEHLEKNLKLADLAHLANMSSCYFATLFKQSTGSTPHQFITQLRLERAQQLLRQSNTSISEIALNCGFSSQSHLTRLFRRQIGVTPKVYRDNIQ